MDVIKVWADEMKNLISGQYRASSNILDLILTALCCGGHILLEDKPGTGKTLLARTIAQLIGGSFSQISCTPDLLPSDIIGISIYDESQESFIFRKGPILSNVVLVDEINRATPRTQSALLEAIAEGQISVEGKTITLPVPFFLLATESPVETEGTFSLPEAQKDRFFMTLSPGYPDKEAERIIMRNTELPSSSPSKNLSFDNLQKARNCLPLIHVAPALRSYILDLVNKTREDRRLVYGVSPRGSLSLYKGAQALAGINGKSFVSPEEIKTLVIPVFRKRILIRPEFLSQGFNEITILEELLSSVEIPIGKEAS